MKTAKLEIIITIIGCIVFAQDYCNNPGPGYDLLDSLDIQRTATPNINNAIINVYYHIMRDGNGNGGISLTLANNAISKMQMPFDNESIYLALPGLLWIHI